ncbi:Golgi transport complex subunit 3 [Borealophlyctis nickersoniae]|nr:Golgi transport complex subunit 3 [Borealophlyctis nickersoniae]
MTTSISRGARVLEEWESKIVLDDKQKESILLLQEACAELPIPEELQNSDVGEDDDEKSPYTLPTPPVFDSPNVLPPSPTTANNGVGGGSSSSIASPGQGGKAVALGLLSEPIENAQQFFNWFSGIEQEMEKGQEDIYRAYLATVYAYRGTCDEILGQIDATTGFLDGLQRNYEFVEDKTKALQMACEKLLEEQTHLVNVAEELTSKLSYFNELEPIMKLFSAPGDTVCLDEKFIPMLERLDECIAFVSTHLRYKDAELYLMRFRQCMTRGMSLIKMHFVNTLRATLNDIKEKIANRDPGDPLSPNMQLSLFYVKFRTLAPKLKYLVSEIEKRCEGHREYFSLLGDCFKTYFWVRQTLLGPYIAAQIQSISTGTDVLTISRSGCAYMMRLCADEYALFYQYFDLGEEELLGYLDSLSTYLYDQLRPMILREVRIDTLAELCQTLHIYLKSTDVAMGHDDSEVEEDESTPVQFVVRKILEDAQQRLVFRAEAYIKQEIEGFKPREEEISLLARGRGSGPDMSLPCVNKVPQPAAISTSFSVAPVLGTPDQGSAPAILDVEDIEDPQSPVSEAGEPETPSAIAFGKLVYGRGEWYPTLQRTLYILGKLYRCVPAAIFEDLAQEAVDLCRQSLVGASDIIAAKQTKLDGQFFLIKNLLMLREQIAPFDANFVRKEELLDFAGLRDAVMSVLQSRWGIGALSTIISASAPTIIESFSDSKQLVDKELKRVCENFILETAKACVEPVSSFMLKVAAFRLRSETQSSVPLSSQTFASPEHVSQAHDNFMEVLPKRLTYAVSKMADYLGDRKTEAVLINVIKSNVIDTYRTFHDTVSKEYPEMSIVPVQDVGDIVDKACRRGLVARRLGLTKGEGAARVVDEGGGAGGGVGSGGNASVEPGIGDPSSSANGNGGGDDAGGGDDVGK